MDKEKILTKLDKIITSSNKILLVTNTRPTLDSVASLFLMWHFLTVNFKKNVNIYIPNFPHRLEYLFNYSMLEKKDIINLFLREYKLSVKKQDGQVDHVRYADDNKSFNFFIALKKGALDLSSVKLDKASFEYDLIVTLDVEDLNFIGDLYKTYKSDFDNFIKIVNIDSHDKNLKFGDLNILSTEYSSTSEIVFNLISQFDSITSQKEYQLVLMSILSNTENLSVGNIPIKTFENLSILQTKGGSIRNSILEVYSPLDIQDFKIKANILKNITEYKYKGKKYLYSVINKGDIRSSYLSEIYMKDVDLTCIAVKGDSLKIYIKDFKNRLNEKVLLSQFKDVKFDSGVYSFNSDSENIEDVLELIANIKLVS